MNSGCCRNNSPNASEDAIPEDAGTPLHTRHGTGDPHALRERVHETLLAEITGGTLPPDAPLDEEDTTARGRPRYDNAGDATQARVVGTRVEASSATFHPRVGYT
ncbi:hypothetical protein [Streptomyces sp. A1136]|uniref:hypothetical protein n=1 Tax=Streptomyces sp. A1136 TaxID=2563102 RepID=UPI00109E6AAF|nr:hypothetical protein [Streptomyces sp. A1136]THA49403.1 hypothetical protein E6R62_27790 [Streptomyces sp. A1136]